MSEAAEINGSVSRPRDPIHFKLQLENELKEVESKLELKTKRLQERLREVAQLQNSLQVPSSPNGESVIIQGIQDLQKNQEVFEEKQRGMEEDFITQMKEKALLNAQERLESEQSKHRYQILLDEERQAATQAKRKSKQLEAELIQIKKRLNQEMTASSQKDQKLQDLQRKFPTLLSELDRTESRCKQLAQDKAELQQQLQSLRREFQQYKEDCHSSRLQDQKVKASLEENNQKILNEVFTLNTRLTESVLLVSELRSKRERDQELMLREATRKAQLEQSIVSLERENKELKSLLQSHSTAQQQGSLYQDERRMFQQQIETLREKMQELQDKHEREVSELKNHASLNDKKSSEAVPHSPIVVQETNEERLVRELEEERKKLQELQGKIRRESMEPQKPEVKSPIPVPEIKDEEPEQVDEEEDNEEEDEEENEEKIVSSDALQKRLYKPNMNDSTDISLGKIIRSKLADGLELLPPNFKRITHGQYRFGTRKIYISLQNNQPVVRVGGGYMIFTSFVKKYGRSECIKTNRADSSSRANTNTAVHRALNKHRRSSPSK